ncbi:MAG: hypothetical protein J6N76_08770, partial [Lachnospiraceae bacterium]|nr:hypothetical protein [Lachnospiraceae bacterium]
DTYMKRGHDERFPYLAEEDATTLFNCRAEYMVDSDYSLVIPGYLEKQIKEVLKLLRDIYG